MSTADLTPPYRLGRRLSGSSSRMNLRDEDMDVLDFNINDISRASSPASVSAKSEGHLHRGTGSDRYRHRHSYRGEEDYRRRYHRMRTELDVERAKVKAMHKDKLEELRQMRHYYEKERQMEHTAMNKKFEDDKKRDLARLKEEMMKLKDYELQQVLKYKEEEIRMYRSQTPGVKTPVSERSRTPATVLLSPSVFTNTPTPHSFRSAEGSRGAFTKDVTARSVEAALELSSEDMAISSQELVDRRKGPSDKAGRLEATLPGELLTATGVTDERADSLCESDIRLQQLTAEMTQLKQQHQDLQQQYEEKTAQEARKERELKEIKVYYEAEFRRVVGEYKKVALGNLQKLKMAEHALLQGAITEGDVLTIPLAAPPSLALKRTSASSSSLLDCESKVAGQQAPEDEARREERERERSLQKQLGELQGQTQRLERRLMLLRTENDTLKKKQEEQKPLEDKVKVLKKRNAELAAIARRLEDKVKALQQEQARHAAKTKEDTVVDSEHLKRVFARQRAKELAEHARLMLEKEREMEELRRRCQQLVDALSNGDLTTPQNGGLYEDKEELVSIVKQAAKERLQLEQQLAHLKVREGGETPERERHRQELQTANDILHQEIEKLESALLNTRSLKEELTKKSEQCESLTTELTELRHSHGKLEGELQQTLSTSAQLAVHVASLQAKLQHYDKVNEECSTLRLALATAQSEREAAKEQVTTLQTQVHSLENLVRDLQDSADQLHGLEHEYKDALSQLASKQQQIQQLHEAQNETQQEYQRVVTELQGKVGQLEAQCRVQEERQQELTSQIFRLQQDKLQQDLLLQEERQRRQEDEERRRLSRRQGSPPLGGIPPSDSADSGLPASGANSDEGSSRSRKPNHDSYGILSPTITGDLTSLALDSEPEQEQGMESNREHLSDLVLLNDSHLSALSMRGPIQVYVAKYSYDPFEYSPNENPEAELQINAGDYVLVLGNMDEDGFFEGELLDGRRGLVPSNFIERVADEDLEEFHAALAINEGHGDIIHTAKARGASALDSDEDTPDAELGINTGKNNFLNNNIYETPAPQELVLDRQLTNSVLISWRPPKHLHISAIQAYHVYLDGALKATLKGSDRTKALLEDVDASQTHRVSVRCLSTQGQSKDNQCTMLIGRDVIPVPSDLGVRNVTQNSACVHWTPANSSYSHIILLDGKEVKVVKSGICQHTLTGLSAETVYQVTIATKPTSQYEERQKWNQDRVSCNIEFKTLISCGVPDPPLNVQVETGPREGTMLVTWLPVTINSSGFSNGSVVTGYVVYANSMKIKEAKGPTNDHVVLTSEDLRGLHPQQLSVRTETVDHVESADSAPALVLQVLMKELKVSKDEETTSDVIRTGVLMQSAVMASACPTYQEADEEIQAAFQNSDDSSPEIDTQIAEPFAESSSSELSDIMEVEEELGLEEATDNSFIQADKVQRSPKPTPRKLSSAAGPSAADKEAGFSPKQFYGKKPDPLNKDSLLTTPLVVPAIEITRDSSTERGASFEDEVDNFNPAHHDSRKVLQQQQKSVEEVVEKPHNPVTHRYRSTSDEPSAFRSLEHDRQLLADSCSTNAGPTQRPLTDNKAVLCHSSPTQRPTKGDMALSGQEKQSDKSRDEKAKQKESFPPPKPARRSPEPVNGRDSITEEMDRVIDDSTVRLFIALFDYDPATMSPNVDSIEEELPFREGQILKVFGDKDADGFFRGEADGREGYIPCNMVSEIHIDDPELVEQLLKENESSARHHQASHADRDTKNKGDVLLTVNGLSQMPTVGPVRRMVALYDYDPQELSPNVDAEVELAFKQGDIIYIMGEMDEDGFYTGELGGVRGLVPSNFLQDAPLSDEDEVLESASMVSPSRSQGSISAASRHSDSMGALNNTTQQKDQQSLSPPAECAIVLDTPSTTPSSLDDKHKKKGGLLNKGRNILKKLAR